VFFLLLGLSFLGLLGLFSRFFCGLLGWLLSSLLVVVLCLGWLDSSISLLDLNAGGRKTLELVVGSSVIGLRDDCAQVS
jgi:hypothetical protein